ncbi:MAG: hypothetical protein ACR2QW_20180 [bacterium]
MSSSHHTQILRNSALTLAISATVLLGAPRVHAAEGETQPVTPVTIDDLGFSGAMNDQLFSSRYSIESNSVVKSGSGSGGFGLQSVIEIESSDPALPFATSTGDLIYSEQFDASGEELEVRRFSTALETDSGILTVGNDWSNFQDFLLPGEAAQGFPSAALANLDRSRLEPGSLITEQISWSSKSGFSVALENEFELAGETLLSEVPGYSTSPSLVLSWKGSDQRSNGQYSFSALGRQLQLDEFEQPEQDTDSFGWGLNLAGGWRFGDLFAALRVTLGNSIDSFILGQLGDRSTAASALRSTATDESINFNPSLSYRLGETSNLHFSLNRFQTSGENTVHGIDTLDTIHLGYTWNPWPSTRFGIEFVGKDVEGAGEMDDSSEVNFAASKQF